MPPDPYVNSLRDFPTLGAVEAWSTTIMFLPQCLGIYQYFLWKAPRWTYLRLNGNTYNYEWIVIFSRGWQSHSGLPKDIIVGPSQPLSPKHSVPFFLPVEGDCSLYLMQLYSYIVSNYILWALYSSEPFNVSSDGF